MKMLEGIKRIYSGREVFSRHLTLFSLCGIFGLLDMCVTVEGIEGIDIFAKFLYLLAWFVFSVFIVGYEVVFLHERELPDIDFRPFQLFFQKPLILFLIFVIPMTFAKIFPEYLRVAFATEMLLAIPLTMIQSGYSYNYNSEEAYKLFEKPSIKHYIALFFKRIWVFIFAYILVSFIVFLIFFFYGTILAIIHSGDMETVGMILSSNQFMITKLSNFITGILLIYFLTISTLVWDYELIKTYEKDTN